MDALYCKISDGISFTGEVCRNYLYILQTLMNISNPITDNVYVVISANINTMK